jgi:hypothetical protein
MRFTKMGEKFRGQIAELSKLIDKTNAQSQLNR